MFGLLNSRLAVVRTNKPADLIRRQPSQSTLREEEFTNIIVTIVILETESPNQPETAVMVRVLLLKARWRFADATGKAARNRAEHTIATIKYKNSIILR